MSTEVVDTSRNSTRWVEGESGWARIEVVVVGEVPTCEVCERPMPGARRDKGTCSANCHSVKRYIKAGTMAPRGRVAADV